MKENPDNVLYKIAVLERQLGAFNKTLNEQTQTIQQIEESAEDVPLPGQHNMLPNGDFDFDRNRFLYTTDFTDADAGTVDADVSEEAYNWFAFEPDTAVESTGSINAGTPNLVIDTPDFIAGDASAEIVVYGAGAAGADLVTTISGAPGSTTTATLAVNASTTVSGARVRWRLRELLEDSTDDNADASNATNTTLKTADHSRYATTIDDPDYDKENGWARLGSTNWLAAPMPKNYFKPSTSYVATFIYKLRTSVGGLDEYQALPFIGLYDNSPGRRQFLEGQPVDVSATVVGTPTGTVSREYYLVFYTGWGEKVGSRKVTVANAPDDASFVTNSVYVYLSWTNPKGVIRTEIYRKTGGTYKLVGLPYPQSDFRDNNTVYSTPIGYPAVDYTRPLALTKLTTSNFNAARTDIWQFAQVVVHVPFDYSAPSDKQWFVFGLQGAIPATDRALEIDKVSIDDKIGGFSICPLDLTAKRGLSSSPQSGSQGNTGGGHGYCPAFTSTVEVESIDGRFLHVPAIELVNNEHLYKIVNRHGERKRFKARVSPGKQVIYRLAADNGKTLRASADHPCFTDERDVKGKSLQEFALNDTILTRNGTLARVLSNVREVKKEYTVKITILDDAERGFWINGFGGHNAKLPDIEF